MLAGAPVAQFVGVDRCATTLACSMRPGAAITVAQRAARSNTAKGFVMVLVVKNRRNISILES